MKKLLVMSDSPTITSGFAKVAYHILRALYATGKYEITVLGCGYEGDGYDRKKFPYEIITAANPSVNPQYNDYFGRQKALNMLGTGEYDIFFSIQDMSVLSGMGVPLSETREALKKAGKDLKIVFYCPVDSYLKGHEEWVTTGLGIADIPVVYTHWGRNQITPLFDSILADKFIRVIYHGVSLNEFFPLPEKDVANLRKTMIPGIDLTNCKVILNINRNSARKDWPATFETFAKLKQSMPEAFLLAVAQIRDMGGDLKAIASYYDLEYGKDWITPPKYVVGKHGYTTEQINKIYNVADVVFSTTLAEGWGLSTVEGMAVKKPLVFPANTVLPEILADNRGNLVPLRGTMSFGPHDSDLVRERVDVEAATIMLYDVLSHGDSAKVENAYEWVKKHTWGSIGEQWVRLFAELD